MSDATDSPDPETNEPAAEASNETSATKKPLRWWPAAVLLLTMLLMRSMISLFDAPSIPVMMIGYMGPSLVGILMLVVWWCFFSRASIGEKLIGFFGFIVIAVAMSSLVHESMAGMGVFIQVLPMGFAAFGLALVLTASRIGWRVPAALLVTFASFGFWNLIQSEGMTGKFQPEYKWRWSPTAEDIYLAGLESRGSLDPAEATELDLTSAEWPAFRGADRSGMQPGITLEEDWEAMKPKEIWRTPIGPGWSSFSVVGNRLYTQEQRGELEAVVCLDADTGEVVWDHTYTSRFWESIAGAGPRATPTIGSQGVFALGAEGILSRLDAATGDLLWKRDLKVDADRKPPEWGFSASPFVTESLVVVHAGGAGDKGLIAYDAETGEPVWSVASGDHSYSSVQAGEFDSVRGLLMNSNLGLQFVSAEDGSTIWEHQWPAVNYRVTQPFVLGDSVLVGSSLGEGSRRITVAHADDGSWTITEDWTSRDIKPDYNDFVVYQDHLYGFDAGIFCCVSAEDGQRQWKRGRYGNGQVLLLPESGQLLVLAERGKVVLLRATPERLTELAEFDALDGKTWNHPVLIGNRLYVRNAEQAACFEMPVLTVAAPAEEASETETTVVEDSQS